MQGVLPEGAATATHKTLDDPSVMPNSQSGIVVEFRLINKGSYGGRFGRCSCRCVASP